MATIIDIADALVAEISARTHSQPVLVEREYLPQLELAQAQTLLVTVVPKGITRRTSGRNVRQQDYELDVAIRKKLQTKQQSEIDDLMSLVDEVLEPFELEPRRLASYPAAIWIGTEVRAPYLPEHLHEFRQFTSVATLTYRVLA